MPMLKDVYSMGDTLALRYATHAHAATVKLQGGQDVHYLRYWVDEARGKVFCLVDAPDATAPAAVHRRAYSLLAKDISTDHINPTQFDTAEIYRVQEGE